MTTVTLPAPLPDQKYITVSALSSGTLTLPDSLFVTDVDPSKRTTVPSLSFLLQHPSPPPSSPSKPPTSSKPHTLVFDLGIKRDTAGYTPLQQSHIAQRQPSAASPDCADSLRAGGLDPADVDTVILSHVHWDHVGTPSDFSSATFVVGSGTLDLLAHGAPGYPAALFNADELPVERTRELPPTPTTTTSTTTTTTTTHADADTDGPAPAPVPLPTPHTWTPLSIFPHAIDFFADSSLYIIDAPGHLPGHINLLARTGPGTWIYLGGDCCHDRRILTGEKGIAVYGDECGGWRSVHADTEGARETVGRVSGLLGEGRLEGGLEGIVEVEGGGEARVEVVLAHDGVWAWANGGRFWPGVM